MPTMAEMLTDEQAARLNAAMHPTTPLAQPGTPPPVPRLPPAKPVSRPAAPNPAPKHLRQCGCERRHDGFTRDGDVLVHKACGRPLPTASVLRGATAVPVVVPCAGGCGVNVTIPTRKSDVTGAPRAATCCECAEAISRGSSVTLVRKAPKCAPVGVTNPKKETPVKVDLGIIPDAKLGETIKEAERERLAAALPAKVEKAKKRRAKKEKAQAKAKKAERRSLQDMGVLPGFNLLGVDVPALDMTRIDGAAEAPSAKARSPYNKVRYREGLSLLPRHTSLDEVGTGVEACTWALLASEHQRMSVLAAEAKPAKAKTKAAEKGKTQIAVPVDLEERQLAAIMANVGCSKKKARKILACL